MLSLGSTRTTGTAEYLWWVGGKECNSSREEEEFFLEIAARWAVHASHRRMIRITADMTEIIEPALESDISRCIGVGVVWVATGYAGKAEEVHRKKC